MPALFTVVLLFLPSPLGIRPGLTAQMCSLEDKKKQTPTMFPVTPWRCATCVLTFSEFENFSSSDTLITHTCRVKWLVFKGKLIMEGVQRHELVISTQL